MRQSQDQSQFLQSPASHKAFINSQFPRLAAVGWQTYQKQGRCALFTSHLLAEEVATTSSTSTANQSLSLTAVSVIPLPQVLLMQTLESVKYEAQIKQQIARFLAEYDPEREIVVVVAWGIDNLSAYKVSVPGITPPDAARQSNARFN